MDGKIKHPKTLQEAVTYYSDPNNALTYMVRLRWPDGVVICPTCGRKDPVFLANQRKWQCKAVHEKRQFSAKVGTVFEDSPIPLEKWLVAVWMLGSCKNGVSSYEISRAIGVTQKSAWFMMHRIRVGMKLNAMGTKLGGGSNSEGGEVEVDESFIGGKLKNMHREKRARLQTAEVGRGSSAKTAVVGMLDRDARQVRAMVVPDVRRDTLQANILKNVKYGSKVYTDNAVAYDRLNWRYIHDVVNHANEYVRGRVHTNGLENFWSLLKRSLHGTYVAVEPFHLERYVDEQVFRYNNRSTKDRPVDDFARFNLAMRGVIGKRLTFAEVTGKAGETSN
jgi:transposase-like protein